MMSFPKKKQALIEISYYIIQAVVKKSILYLVFIQPILLRIIIIFKQDSGCI